MIKSHHLYPFFPDLIENQRRSVQCFWEKGLLEEFELFSYILGKKKNLQMILHGSKFMLQRPKYTIHEAVRKQKSYSVSLFLPIEFKWYENGLSLDSRPDDGFSPIGDRRLRPKFAGSLDTGGTSSATEQAPISKAPVGAKPTQGGGSPEAPLSPQPIATQIFPVFLGDIPLMTERGTFLINGSARVLVNQIVRCPSVYFKVKIDHKNRRTYIASFLSDYGSWLRLETDYKSRIWVRIDKSQRVSIYALLRSLGFPESFLQYQLKYYSFLFASRESYYTEKPNEAIQYLWKKLTPGRWNSIQGCYAFLYNKFFNPRRYSIGPVGRLRLNKRLNRKTQFKGAEPWSLEATPEDLWTSSQSSAVQTAPSPGREGLSGASPPQTNKNDALPAFGPVGLPTLTPEDIFMALDLLIQLHYGEGYLDDIDHLKNRRVRLPGELIQNQFRLALSRITQIATEKITKFEVEKDLRDRKSGNEVTFGSFATGSKRTSRIEETKGTERLDVGTKSRTLEQSSQDPGLLAQGAPESIQDEAASQSLSRPGSSGARASEVRAFGLQGMKSSTSLAPNTFRGFAIKSFFQAQLFGSSLRELFHTSQLSQYMDQTNPLAEITHKRRLSSLGPGGIGRDQAGFAVREIHPSHFGRICPIETPEGPNAGLVGSLASYCRITENGFLQSPYFAAPGAPVPTAQIQKNLVSKLGAQMSEQSSTKGRSSRSVSAFDILKQSPSEWFLFSAEVEDESYICAENGVTLALSPQNPSDPHACRAPLVGDEVFIKNLAEKLTEGFSQRLSSEGLEVQKLYPTRYKQEFLTVEKNRIQFFSVSPIQMISLATSLIPFLEHDDANRALMGSNMQRQAVPILFAEKPLVGTGLEIQAARDSSTTLLVKQTGQITYVDGSEIIVQSSQQPRNQRKRRGPEPWNLGATPTSPVSRTNGCSSTRASGLSGPSEVYKLQNYWRSNQNTCLRQRPQVNQGEWVEKGDLLADGSATQHGEIALGKNILLAYMPWEGYNFEDAIVINERLVQEDIYTSIHIDRYDIEIRETSYGKEKITHDLPYINSEQTRNLDSQGIIFPGTWVEEGDILVGKITPISPPKPTPEYRLLLAIFETKPLPFKETSLRVPQGVEGRVLDCIIEYQSGGSKGADRKGEVSLHAPNSKLKSESAEALKPVEIWKSEEQTPTQGVLLSEVSTPPSSAIAQKVQIFLAHKRKIQLGDKMSGRHGNKGIVSLILPPQDMPFLQDGTPVDIVLNPLGVPSRMNVGQVLECLFGLAGHYLKQQYRLLPFDEMYGVEASRGLVYEKLYEASRRIGYDWLFDPNSPGKSHLFDGRTGEPFHQPILVGYSYMFKLIHLVDEKMHARSTGPYSLVTQQPLGGRSKHGGQRLGEMEVWALEGFGAASILQEFLTVKSDEIYARNTFLFHLMKRRKLPRPGLPESFRVLVHELQSLCLSVYYNPDFRLTYPSLIGWDGLFLLSSKKFPTLQQLSNLKNI